VNKNNFMKKLFLIICFSLIILTSCKSQNNTNKTVQVNPVQKLVSDQRAYYPRIIRYSHNKIENGNLLSSFDSDGGTANFFKSTDDGKTWSKLSSFDENTPPGHCCSGLYEVPATVGNTEAGTLFWATSIGRGQDPRVPTALKIYQSKDSGTTWSFLSSPVIGSIGLWEAEFIMNDKKQLIMYYSSEEHKDKGYNQLLAHKVSIDGGLTWGNEVFDVAMKGGIMRPGMAIVRKMNNGKYFMSYEICGSGCDVFIRTSDDGLNWGNPEDPGIRVESSNGNHFAHAPTIMITPDNELVLIGQLLISNAENKIVADNGKVYMYNKNNGTGLWVEMKSPVSVIYAKDDPCPNYSSQLLLTSDNKNLIEIALQYDGSICKGFYNITPFTKP